MKKNAASQVIGAQMVSASDGSAFTGSVTVYVTVDAGTQAIGSVGSGVCTHEGNGFHTYAPAQAETNGDHVAFTFIGTGAVPSTVQVFPSFPQTGDSFGLIGAAGAGLTALATAANLATVDTAVDAIKAKTDNLPASPAAVSNIPTATENADALLNRDMSAVSDTNARSPLNALRFLRNKWSISGTTLTVTKENDSTSAWTSTVTATTGADPITGNDPA